ncbi:hypothetical protein GCM10029978_017680 [Actinoallomurus acanthiterrae]
MRKTVVTMAVASAALLLGAPAASAKTTGSWDLRAAKHVPPGVLAKGTFKVVNGSVVIKGTVQDNDRGDHRFAMVVIRYYRSKTSKKFTWIHVEDRKAGDNKAKSFSALPVKAAMVKGQACVGHMVGSHPAPDRCSDYKVLYKK